MDQGFNGLKGWLKKKLYTDISRRYLYLILFLHAESPVLLTLLSQTPRCH